jgi:nucleoside-diphosphate-sugar epimerase
MRVIVTGATGNVGTSVLAAPGREPKVTEIVGLARRVPEVEMPKVTWVAADVAETPLNPDLRGRRRGRPPRLDISRARDELGWEPKVGARNGP